MDGFLAPLRTAGFTLVGEDFISEGYRFQRWSFPGGSFRACVDIFNDVCYSGRIFCKGGVMHIGGNKATGHEADADVILDFIRTHAPAVGG